MRGDLADVGRTIPTRVGRTHCTGESSRALKADHPHAGGELLATTMPFSNTCGPSPRGWGTRVSGNRAVRVHRTIPTRVGRTPAPRLLPCAEQRTIPTRVGRTQVGRDVLVPVSRTIPTRVGNSPASRSHRTDESVHPHAGGELDSYEHPSDQWGGPSPRGWGTHLPGSEQHRPQRTIPTRVGNSPSCTISA